jgi:uncharacterized protein (DUF433 family)
MSDELLRNNEMNSKIRSLDTLTDYIVCNPQIMLGKPIIIGTRITVEQIVLKASPSL